jgi:hypothetical protein
MFCHVSLLKVAMGSERTELLNCMMLPLVFGG